MTVFMETLLNRYLIPHSVYTRAPRNEASLKYIERATTLYNYVLKFMYMDTLTPLRNFSS